MPPSKRPKIVVIGAGLAGLTAAYRLHQKGHNVSIYEARPRVGGRILSATLQGTTIELGGQNISDGGKGEYIHRLIEEFQLDLDKIQVVLKQAFFDGEKLIPGSQLRLQYPDKEALREKLSEIGAKSRSMQEVLDHLLPKENPLYTVLSTRLAAYEGAPIQNLSSIYVDTLYYMLLGSLSSAHYSAHTEENTIDFVSIRGGNSLLPEKMAKILGENVHLNSPLAAITKTADGAYKLQFQNKESVTADIVILAIPCPIYNDITFSESVIPKDKLTAIRNVQYGTNGKMVTPSSHLQTTPLALINDRMGCFPQAGRKILILYYTGASSRFSSKTLAETYERDWPMIEKGLGEKVPDRALASMARDESFASYDGLVAYSWPEDIFAKGSYSCIAPGQEALLTMMHQENGETVKTLFAPIEKTLYFAGEHASILLDAPGTMEAACESGERCARMVCNGL